MRVVAVEVLVGVMRAGQPRCVRRDFAFTCTGGAADWLVGRLASGRLTCGGDSSQMTMMMDLLGAMGWIGLAPTYYWTNGVAVWHGGTYIRTQ